MKILTKEQQESHEMHKFVVFVKKKLKIFERSKTS